MLDRLDGEAHVWLRRPGVVAAAELAWLDDHEQARHTRLRRREDRDLYLLAHVHLRTTLSRYADLAPHEWTFTTGAHGRPGLGHAAGTEGLRFSLSHTPGLVACAVTRNAECGVDVERDGRVDDVESVARAVFTDREQAAVRADPKRFVALWTRKEAYVKAIGLGLHAPVRELDVATAPPGWTLCHRRATAEHHLAIAVRPERMIEVGWA